MLCNIRVTIGAFEKSTNSRSKTLMAWLRRGLAYRVGCRWLLRLRYVESERNALDAPFRIFALECDEEKISINPALPGFAADAVGPRKDSPSRVSAFFAVAFPRSLCSCFSVKFYQPRHQLKVCCSQRHLFFSPATNLSKATLPE